MKRSERNLLPGETENPQDTSSLGGQVTACRDFSHAFRRPPTPSASHYGANQTTSFLSLRFNGHFQVDLGQPVYENVSSILDFIGAKGDGGGGNNWIRRAKLQSKCRHQQTNTQLTNAAALLCVGTTCKSRRFVLIT